MYSMDIMLFNYHRETSTYLNLSKQKTETKNLIFSIQILKQVYELERSTRMKSKIYSNSKVHTILLFPNGNDSIS